MSQPDWVQAHDDRALKYEQKAQEQTSAAMRLALAEATRRLAAEYVRAAGGLKEPVPDGARDALSATVRRIVTALLTGFVSELPAVAAALEDVVAGGLQLGTRAGQQRPRRVALRPSEELRSLVAAVGGQLREDVAAARKALDGMRLRSFRDVTAAVAPAVRVVNNVAAAAASAANKAVNEGVRATADAAGVPVLWVAERDACLACYAYSGLLAESGEPFPGGLTYGDKPITTDPVMAPPLHLRCRCRLQSWYGTEPNFGVEFPTALKREAERSVLQGRSAYSSRPAKMRAADRLLKTALSGLPETVKLRAKRNVAAGVAAWTPASRPPKTSP